MKSNNVSLISGVLFSILGGVVFFHPDVVVKFISYFMGGLLILIGAYKLFNYFLRDKKNGVMNPGDLAFGVIAIVLGLLFVFLAGTIEFLIRFIIGGWLIIAGIGKLLITFNTTNRTKKFYSILIIGFIYIVLGLYIILVSNLALSVIGLFMALYGITDIVSVFVSKDLVKEQEEKKDIKVIEAELVEKNDNKLIKK